MVEDLRYIFILIHIFLYVTCNRLLYIVQQTDAEFSELSLHEATPAEKDEAENMKNKGLC